MNGTIHEVEAQRVRRRRYRMRQGLTLDAGEMFRCSGLGRHVDGLEVRLLILPADPEGDAVPLDSEMLAGLKEPRTSPYGGPAPRWGDRTHATNNALVLYDQYREDAGWARYLALHRHGGIEVGGCSAVSGPPGSDLLCGRYAGWVAYERVKQGDPVNLSRIGHECWARWRHRGEGQWTAMFVSAGQLDDGRWYVDVVAGTPTKAHAFGSKRDASAMVRIWMATRGGPWERVPFYPSAAVTAVASSAGPRRTASKTAVHEVRPGSNAATKEYGQPGII